MAKLISAVDASSQVEAKAKARNARLQDELEKIFETVNATIKEYCEREKNSGFVSLVLDEVKPSIVVTSLKNQDFSVVYADSFPEEDLPGMTRLNLVVSWKSATKE